MVVVRLRASAERRASWTAFCGASACLETLQKEEKQTRRRKKKRKMKNSLGRRSNDDKTITRNRVEWPAKVCQLRQNGQLVVDGQSGGTMVRFSSWRYVVEHFVYDGSGEQCFSGEVRASEPPSTKPKRAYEAMSTKSRLTMGGLRFDTGRRFFRAGQGPSSYTGSPISTYGSLSSLSLVDFSSGSAPWVMQERNRCSSAGTW